MEINGLLQLYEVKDLIFEDKKKIEGLLELYTKEKEQYWRKVFESQAKVYENIVTHEKRATIFSVEYLNETWEEYFERKLSEDDEFLFYKERILYREKALTKIECEIDKRLKEWSKSIEF